MANMANVGRMGVAVAIPRIERVRQCRARRKAGLAVFQIEADEVALADALVTAGLLSLDKVDDRKAVSAALRHAVEIFVRSNSL